MNAAPLPRVGASPRPEQRRRTAGVVALLAVVALVWFGGLGHRKLIKPDEGRYAEIPREMVVTGDWLTPRLNDLQYFEKPPLQYWTTAAAYEAFGVSEWTSRLWTALTGFLGVIVVGATATRLYGVRTGLFSATVLASSLAFVLLSHFNTLDMGLAFFMTGIWCAVLLARDARRRESAPDTHCGADVPAADGFRHWMLVAWASLALATLSKGPVAVVLCGGALVLYLALSRDWALLRILRPVRGLAVFALIAGPWFVAVSRANPGFAHFFFIHEHVERFLTTEHRREGPVWYFVPVLVIGVLPWLSVTPSALVRAWRAPPRDGFSPERLVLALIVVVFAFFSASGSKLPSYILPVFPAIAVLVGHRLAHIDAATLRRHVIAMAALAAVATVAVSVAPLDSREGAAAITRFRHAASLSLAAWLVGTLIAVALAWRGRVTGSVLAAGLAALVGWSALLLSHEALGRGESTYDLARALKPSIAADTPIYSVGLFEHTLPFYLQRPVTLVAFRDELDFGLTQEPDKGIATLPAFIERWNADRAPLAIMAADVFDTLSAARLPMRIVARDGRRIVVGKPSGSPEAGAEATGAAGSSEPMDPPRTNVPMHRTPPHP